MNIAYLFSGHSRTWMYCFKQFYDNIYRCVPGDIFIHTWDCINAPFKAHWNKWSEELKNMSMQKADINNIIKIYDPIQCMIEKDIGLDYWSKKYPNIDPPYLGIKNFLYSQKRVFEMSKTYKIYDRYMMTRLDINYISKIDMSELLSDDYIVSDSLKHPKNMVFDFWSIGSMHHMEIKSNFLENIDKYWFTQNMDNYHYENALHAYLNDNQINLRRSNIKYNVPRINNTTTSYN